VDLPKVSAPEMQVWSPEQLRVFLAHVRADRLFARRPRAGQVKVAKPRVAVRYQVHVEERLMIGPGWVESGLVLTWPDGRALHPERFTRRFQQHARDAGLPKIRLHDVRHSFATAALAAGVPAKIVSERLGHANIAITMDTYSHVLPGMDERAASAVARLILSGEAAPARVP
jgi:integrase